MEENIQNDEKMEEAGAPDCAVKSGKGKPGMTPKKKSILLIVIALAVGIAIGVVSCLCIANMQNSESESNTEGSIVSYFSGTLSNGLRWNINPTTFILDISGSGAIPDYTSSNPAPWDKSYITGITIESGITGIGTNAFVNCTNAIKVEIYSDKLTSVSSDSFPKNAVFTVNNATVKKLLVSKGYTASSISLFQVSITNVNGNTITADDLGEPDTFVYQNQTYAVYNDMIPKTTGSNWQNAVDFVEELNADGYLGCTDWQLLDSQGMSERWAEDFDGHILTDPVYYIWSSVDDSDGFGAQWSLDYGWWGFTGKAAKRNDIGFVVLRPVETKAVDSRAESVATSLISNFTSDQLKLIRNSINNSYANFTDSEKVGIDLILQAIDYALELK